MKCVLMTVVGQSRPFDHIHAMSGLPLASGPTLVKFVGLISAISRHMRRTNCSLFDHVGGGLVPLAAPSGRFLRLIASSHLVGACTGSIPPRRSRSIAAQQGLDKKRGDFGDALDQLGNVRDKLHNSVPKGRKDSFIPFTHGLFHEALPRQTGLFIS